MHARDFSPEAKRQSPDRADARLGSSQRGDAVRAVLAAPGVALASGVRAEMQARLGHDFSDVRVHTDAAADTSARALNALAYTSGYHIAFRSGQLNTGSTQGRELLAHELTHVVQQRQGPVSAVPIGGGIARSDPSDSFERAADTIARDAVAAPLGHRARAPEPSAAPKGPKPVPAASDGAATSAGASTVVVQTKLAGTRAAVEEWGGPPTRMRRVSREKYTMILRALDAYEKLEASVIARQQLSSRTKATMLTKLTKLERLVDDWLAEHGRIDPEDAQRRTVDWSMEANERALRNEPEPDRNLDRTTDEGRSHALIMLKPRLANEKRELQRPDYLRTSAWTDATLTHARDDAFGGGINRLDYLEHGAEKGVFIQDRAWDVTGTVGKEMGIPDTDANSGARSVAMSRLAELFETDVIAATEFAVHASATDRKGYRFARSRTKLGVRQALAPGKEAAETPAVITPAERTSAQQITLADPKLQQSLNVLQIIDAIAGQLDRHWHNYYIATDDQGRVTGVVGIDLDMAFAAGHTTIDPAPRNLDGRQHGNFVGMPELVDESFARKIKDVSPRDVEQVLKGLVSDAELAATLQRYQLVRDAIEKIERNRKKDIVGDWNEKTAKRQHDDMTSYLGKMRSGIITDQFKTPSERALDEVCAELRIDDPDVVKNLFKNNLLSRVEQDVLTPAEGMDVCRAVIKDLRKDREWRSALKVFQMKRSLATKQADHVARQAKGYFDELNDLQWEEGTLRGQEKEQGVDNSARLQAISAREKQVKALKAVADKRVNELRTPDWVREFQAERNHWLVSLIDFHTTLILTAKRVKSTKKRQVKKRGLKTKKTTRPLENVAV